MKKTFITVIAAVVTCLPAMAQPKDNAADRQAIEALGKAFQDTWNRHDMEAASRLLAEEVDFVTVLGPNGWVKGRADWLERHARMHKTLFAESVWKTREVHVKFLRPDLAVARVLWSTTGDKVRHIKHGEPREGIFTWIVEKREGMWLIIASQNTEVMPVLHGQ